MNTKAILFFLLLQSVICLQYAGSTRLQNDINPCFISHHKDSDVTLYCSKGDITLAQIKIGLNDIKDLGSISVELYRTNLGTVPSNFFEGYKVKSLTIAYCKLDSLSGGGGRPLQGLEYSLERLVIKGSLSHGNDFKNSSLSHLRNLREIDLESNSFGEVGNDWFKNPPPLLSSVIFSENKVDAIGDKILAEISTLEFVVMSRTRFRSITRSMFPHPADKLTVLHLIGDELTSLPETLFTNMPRLKTLSLAENSLSELPEKVWRPVWNQLRDIDLSRNPLHCDSHMDWMTLEKTCAKIFAKCKSPDKTSGKRPPQITYGNCIKEKDRQPLL